MPCFIWCHSTEREAVCGRLRLNKRPQKNSRSSWKLRRNGYGVSAIRRPMRRFWTLSSNGRGATRIDHVRTLYLPATAHTQRRQPPGVDAARLVKLQGEQQREAWFLPLERPALVGCSGQKTSSLDVDLWPDTAVSRQHAPDPVRWAGMGSIEDLRSANGTLLENSNIRGQRAMQLAPGTIIQFGHTLLRLTSTGV